MRSLCAVFVLLTSPALAADPIVCPPGIELTPQATVKPVAGWRALPMAERHPLAGARLFDGDPADLADLVPDRNTTQGASPNMIWELRPGMSYTFVCTYAGTEMTMAAKVPAEARQCVVATKTFANSRPPRNTYIDATCR